MRTELPGRFLSSEDALRRLLEEVGVRATAQRIGLAGLLFGAEHRHVAASELHLEAAKRGLSISMATVYNTLGQFVQAGLLRQVTVDSDRTYFDTNIEPHCHVYDETSGDLTDVPLPDVALPDGIDAARVQGVELLFRIRG